MKEFEVTCINRPYLGRSHQHITHIGNASAGWRITRESAIARIEAKTEAFYTIDKPTGQRAYIGVVREWSSAPYLRAHIDGKWNDSLLAQGICGPECG